MQSANNALVRFNYIHDEVQLNDESLFLCENVHAQFLSLFSGMHTNEHRFDEIHTQAPSAIYASQ